MFGIAGNIGRYFPSAPPTPPFDITTLDHTGLWLGGFSASPYNSIASAGVSGDGLRFETNAFGIGLAAGAVVNGHGSVRYTGGAANGGSLRWNGGNTGTDGFLSLAGFTAWFLFRSGALDAKDATVYTNRLLYCSEARWGGYLSQSGIGVWNYTGVFASHDVGGDGSDPPGAGSDPSGAWHYAALRWFGNNSASPGNGTYKIDVDNVPGTPFVMANLAASIDLVGYTGVSEYTSHDGSNLDILARGLSQVVFSDADIAHIYGGLKALYPAAGLP